MLVTKLNALYEKSKHDISVKHRVVVCKTSFGSVSGAINRDGLVISWPGRGGGWVERSRAGISARTCDSRGLSHVPSYLSDLTPMFVTVFVDFV